MYCIRNNAREQTETWTVAVLWTQTLSWSGKRVDGRGQTGMELSYSGC